MKKTANDIHERIYSYVIRVLKLIKVLQNNPENLIIIPQITRSVTSIGANDREADGTVTRNDFIHKYSIVRKEAKETIYWLNIIADTNTKLKPRMQALLKEGEEIIKIVSTITHNASVNRNK